MKKIKYPHVGRGHKCLNCAWPWEKCDENDGKVHCFIRIMGRPFLTCLFCGRWERLRKDMRSRAGD